MPEEPLTCFLVAPFGEKKDQLGGGTVGHFELLRSAVKEIVESFPDTTIRLKRADEIVDVGSVPETFIGALYKADIVIAELSATGNANVFYELGIRFALRRTVTIPIWQQGTQLPADVRGILGVEYQPANPLVDRDKFYHFIRQRLAGQLNDSPVYRVLPDLQVIDAAELLQIRGRVDELEHRLAETLLDDSVQLVWDEAEELLARADLKGALVKLKLAHDHAPRNLRLCIRYGQLLSRGRKHDEAIDVLTKAVTIAETSGGPRYIAYRELGMAYSRAGKAQLAVDWLEKSVAEEPSDSDAHGIIGGVYKEQLEIDKALESYQRGFDADDKSTYCLLNVIALLLVRNQAGDKVKINRLLPKADSLTAEATASEGADHWAQFDRAHYFLYKHQSDDAISTFDEALAATKTIGELDSARKNLNLLDKCDVKLKGLTEILNAFDNRASELKLKSP